MKLPENMTAKLVDGCRVLVKHHQAAAMQTGMVVVGCVACVAFSGWKMVEYAQRHMEPEAPFARTDGDLGSVRPSYQQRPWK